MIDRPTATRELARMGQLDFPPKSDQEIAESEYALMVAETPAIAHQVVSDWLNSEVKFPKPAELRERCYAENDRVNPPPPPWQDTGHPLDHMQGLGGVFKRGLYPKLDEHLDSIVAFSKCKPGSAAHGIMLERMRKLTQEVNDL